VNEVPSVQRVPFETVALPLSYRALSSTGGTRTRSPQFVGLRVCAVRPELQLRESDLNRRPVGYEPTDLPG
jgi:hypothetical protein